MYLFSAVEQVATGKYGSDTVNDVDIRWELHMPKRLVVCCDGTWNTPDEYEDVTKAPVATNVTKLAFCVEPADRNGLEQRVFYGRGVGTGKLDHLSGGALGVGLSARIQEAYMFLVENFEDGDELFLFGFSRGAYTARSLAGFVRNSGILRRRYAQRLDIAYDLYRDRSSATRPRANESTLFRRTYSHEPDIKFIGVWDTVGSLGIPDIPVPATISNYWKFHDVTLSTHVEFAYQALALDERRKPFLPTLWDQDDNAPRTQKIEQVWFSGVHSDVGGGYRDAGLSDIALLWMIGKAQACGLSVDPTKAPIPVRPCSSGQLHDSMTWFYRGLGDGRRWVPSVRWRQGTGAEKQPMRTHETVAATADKRWNQDPGYRFDNLREYRDRYGTFEKVPDMC